MKVAVTEHQGRIAPVFDTSTRLLLFTHSIEGDREIASEDWSMVARHIRATRLRELGVEALICGGISCWMEEQIIRQGIQLMPWRAGEISELLTALRKGTITDPCYAMPGRVNGCQRRGRGQGLSQGRGFGKGRGIRKE